MKKDNFFLQIVSSNSKVSSKRIVTLAAFVLLGIAFISNLYWNFDIDPALITSMEYISIAGLGFTASEKFGKSSKPEQESNNEPTA